MNERGNGRARVRLLRGVECSKGGNCDTSSKEDRKGKTVETRAEGTRGLGAPKCVITRTNREELFSPVPNPGLLLTRPLTQLEIALETAAR